METISGVLTLKGLNFYDNRGSLKKTFYQNREIKTLDFVVKEIWFTKSKKGVVRGMHLQLGKTPGAKIISVIKGEVLDVLFDLRPDSETYLNSFSIKMSGESDEVLYIPPGVAHGYKTLSEDTIVMYVSDVEHSEQDDIGIKWNSINFDWNIENPIISDKDSKLISLEEYIKNIKKLI